MLIFYSSLRIKSTRFILLKWSLVYTNFDFFIYRNCFFNKIIKQRAKLTTSCLLLYNNPVSCLITLILLTLPKDGGLILEEMEFVGAPILVSLFSFHTYGA